MVCGADKTSNSSFIVINDEMNTKSRSKSISFRNAYPRLYEERLHLGSADFLVHIY